VPCGASVKLVLELLASCTTMLWTGHVRYDVPTLFTPETVAKTVVVPGACAVSTPLVIAVLTVAVPLQVAVPLLKVAVLGAIVAPCPGAVIVNCVPPAIVFEPVNATVAVAPVTPLKLDRSQVWPFDPLIVPPEVYVGVAVLEEYVDTIPEELAATNGSLEPKANGPTVEVILHGAEGEQPGAVVLNAAPEMLIGFPIVVQLLPRTACT
jgi:hypothetical protein